MAVGPCVVGPQPCLDGPGCIAHRLCSVGAAGSGSAYGIRPGPDAVSGLPVHVTLVGGALVSVRTAQAL